jgi:hypothetical protein
MGSLAILRIDVSAFKSLEKNLVETNYSPTIIAVTAIAINDTNTLPT